MKTCTKCGVPKPFSEFHKAWLGRGDKNGLQSWCRLCRKFYTQNYRRLLRQKAIDKLGGKCCKCGFSDARALQIDHVNGGGSQERKQVNGSAIIFRALNDTTGAYQLLCANCNWIKRVERNEVCGSGIINFM